MKPFRERNPVVVGLVGFVVIAVAMLGAFRADRLPVIGGGDVYSAEFAEVGALRAGDEVRIAGVSVGKVRSIELVGDRVRVEFVLTQDADLGSEPRAEIRIRTLLGAAFLALQPAGTGSFAEGESIPLSRTTAPYDVVQAFTDLSDVTGEIDSEQLAVALEAVGEVAGAAPVEFAQAIDSLSDLSANIAGRDAQINQLLSGLTDVSGVLSARNASIQTLLADTGQLTAAITERRDAIHEVLVATQAISAELTSLVESTRADLGLALDQLSLVTDRLTANIASLDEVLRVAPTFARLFSEALGSGPFFDGIFAFGFDLPAP